MSSRRISSSTKSPSYAHSAKERPSPDRMKKNFVYPGISTEFRLVPGSVNQTMPLYYSSSPDDRHYEDISTSRNPQTTQSSQFTYSSDNGSSGDEQERKKREDAEEAWVHALIDGVRRYPCIWQQGGEDHKNQLLREDCWKKIALHVRSESGIEKTVEVLKKRWKTRKDDYFKQKKPLPTGSAAERSTKKRNKAGKYNAALSFLDDIPRHKPVRENFPPPASTVSSNRPELALGTSTPVLNPSGPPETDHSLYATGPPGQETKKRKNDVLNQAIDTKILETLGQMSAPPPPKMNRYVAYGNHVTRTLQSIRDKAERKKAADEIIDWIKRYESFDSDDSS